MKKRLIHKKRINKITDVLFSYNDVSIEQDGAIVVLDKDEIVEIARLIENERQDQEYYEKLKMLHEFEQ